MKTIIFLFCSFNAISQVEVPPQPNISVENPKNSNQEFDCPEATFPGGANELQKFINENIDCDFINSDSLVQKVYVQFFVEEDGSLTNIEVLRGINSEINECCIRLIQKMPKWYPEEDCEGNKNRSIVRFPIKI